MHHAGFVTLDWCTSFLYSVTKLKEFDMVMDNIFFPRKDRQTERQTDRQTFGLIEAPCRSLKIQHTDLVGGSCQIWRRFLSGLAEVPVGETELLIEAPLPEPKNQSALSFLV